MQAAAFIADQEIGTLDQPCREPCSSPVQDVRFRALLPAGDWNTLPPAVRKRFSKRVSDGATIVYKGHVSASVYSRAGYILAQLLRFVGAPLPIGCAAGLESVVTVTEDRASKGQFWTRLFARQQSFPQIIHSVKRFSGPTGLEEALPFGIVMALRISAVNGSLCFTSAGYAVEVGRLRFSIPAFLTPGLLVVTHTEIDAQTFRFTMCLEHARLGVLLKQEAIYREDAA